MCALCDEVGGLGDGVGLSDRPPHRLAGFVWEGSHVEAARGAIHPLFARVRAFADSRDDGLWRSPIVGLSLDEKASGFRYFVAVAVEPGEAVPAGMTAMDMPEMTFASIWHLPEDGDVAAHYERIAGMVRDAGLAWDRSHLLRREEYPPDFDPSQPPSLRLMLPVARPDRA
jgi:predicted transcriptional regulator YdeE